jgi:imidazolonepropionase-like amidohydrolase
MSPGGVPRLLLYLGALFAAGEVLAQPAPDIAIVNATIIDGTGAEPRQGTVLIRGDRIAAVGANVTVPAGARVIEGRGHVVLPGLFDLHTHLTASAVEGLSGDWPKILKAYLYCGVTSVVEFGTYPETFEPMRRLLREGVIPGPRIHLAARITTPLGHGAEGGRGDFFSLEVQTPREARAAIKRWLAYKPDAIKVFTDGWRYGTEPDMTSMEEETLRAIVEDAHAQGVEVLTHTVTLEKAKIAARAGVDVIAHGVGNAEADDELIKLMREKGTTYAPTLAVYEAKPRGIRSPLLRVLLEPAAIQIRERQAAAPTRPAPPNTARQTRWQNLTRNTAVLNNAGIRFGTGTDAGVTGAFHGYSTLREIELLAAGGLTPLQALTAATGNSAKALHVEAERGVIAEGKLADLVLVEGTPHRNIADIHKIRQVFLNGKQIDREKLAHEIAAPGATSLPARKVAALVDDFESPNGRTRLDTLRVNTTDSGVDNSRMLFEAIPRPGGGKALSIHARMAEKLGPYTQLVLPLSQGGVEPVNASAFQGVQFEARGDGRYRLLVAARTVRDWIPYAAPFDAGPEWAKVAIPFTALTRARSTQPATWTGRDLTALIFEVARQPGAFGWLQIDNVRFY